MTRGRFITFEGGEGAGKTTQVRLLAEALRAAGIQVVETREPGGSPGAEQIRELLIHGATERWEPMTEALLHFAARAEHLRHRVKPALEAGRWVLSDRFTDSTMAYQGYGLGLGREPVDRLRELVVGALDPDLTLILDLPVAEGLRRAAGRRDGGERYERMGRDFHQRLREGFLDIARREPGRCVVIDAGGAVEQVRDVVRAAVWRRWQADLP
jgi:dTMP kinase